MISIIVCSRKPDVSIEFRNNVSETIGTMSDGNLIEYEIISIDNSRHKYNICQAYNKGTELAKGEYLCFIHDDVLFCSNNWGRAVIDVLKEKRVGMSGIAGTHFLPDAAGGWWSAGTRSQNIVQGRMVEGKYVRAKVVEDTYRKRTDSLVAADGVFLCFRKEMFDYIRWDEETNTGFNGYDIDISLQVLQSRHEIKMMWDVLVEHKSLGNINERFISDISAVFEKWKDYLPQIRGIELTEEEIGVRSRMVAFETEYLRIRYSKEFRLGNVLCHTDVLMASLMRRIGSLKRYIPVALLNKIACH